MENLKISTKALIIRDNSILVVKKSPECSQKYYTLPGGTQKAEETLHRSLAREVFEETGATIDIEELIWTSERRIQPKSKQERITHKIEYIFRCFIKDGYKARMGPIPDSNQTGVRWLSIEKLEQYRIAPKRLRATLNDLLLKLD
ncbi:NUDIX domain-containing protein [Candidatus Pelagisphaera phototrophica]|uniref:NUDIX domain-containing protein n=1 Tax=Candidatus Pelagisphaera phototrophica TaxID=2684113 RepID=UPI0019FFFEEB|nr:NUDIX domain-containing protein [Candidatus Pelagisphaera phototrophica]QXD31644.1 NUDIX domain-containing protein [Candidatus Pelagisphaera phototrophica]